jgi:hypothetical protein
MFTWTHGMRPNRLLSTQRHVCTVHTLLLLLLLLLLAGPHPPPAVLMLLQVSGHIHFLVIIPQPLKLDIVITIYIFQQLPEIIIVV